ncbi:MAG: Rrf2 family transcriptional regulator [Helicobacteraceae bacterium]|nr:Rrf2 family transcriptional regulator [Helicobacteraceae bacterium]
MVCISSKGVYSLSAMLYLAQQGDNLVQIKEIADGSNIPQNYLEQLLVQLKKVGFVESIRGAKGGYKMAISPEKVTVLQILYAMESEGMNPEKYGLDSPALDGFWEEMNKKIENLFAVPLQELVDRAARLSQAAMYHI